MPRSREIPKIAEGLTLQAHRKWDAGELVSAFRLMRRAVLAGDHWAMLNLGYFHDRGIGTKKNSAKAMEWYKKAYRRGVSSAPNNIGTIFRAEDNYSDALAWFQRAVKLGDIEANIEIARMYLRDAASFLSAIPYLKIVIEAGASPMISAWGCEEAQRMLDRIEWVPEGRNAEEVKLKADALIANAERERQGGSLRPALRAYQAAARLGDPYAEFYLGEAYFEWDGVRRDWVKALHWFKQAYKHGVTTADYSIGWILREENATQALIWFKRAYLRGDDFARAEIVKIYQRNKRTASKAAPYLETVSSK
jgi:TPR repeat protein